ncbi:MAG: sulfotransferase [Phormidesmis sp.]
MTLPNFLIFGVQKAGTTSVYNYLKQHPQVYTSPIKETEFLSRKSARKPELLNDEDRTGLTKGGRQKIVTIERYEALFDAAGEAIALGEASPNYLFAHEQAVPNIQTYIPHAKLIAILRNPVERAYSDYLMSLRQVVGNHKPLAAQVETSRQTSHTLLKGLYYEGTKHFLDAFGPEQVKIFLFDDLRQSSAELMRELYEFIGVDSSFTASTQKKSQTAEVPKNSTINRLLRTKNPIREGAAKVLRAVVSEENRQKLRSQLISANSRGKEYLPLTNDERRLLEDYYRQDILQLQELLGRDLSHWFKADR